MATDNIILPFVVADRGGKPVPRPARKAADAGEAATERTAGQHAGDALLEEACDPERGTHAEPRLIRAIGVVPDEMLEGHAA